MAFERLPKQQAESQITHTDLLDPHPNLIQDIYKITSSNQASHAAIEFASSTVAMLSSTVACGMANQLLPAKVRLVGSIGSAVLAGSVARPVTKLVGEQCLAPTERTLSIRDVYQGGLEGLSGVAGAAAEARMAGLYAKQVGKNALGRSACVSPETALSTGQHLVENQLAHKLGAGALRGVAGGTVGSFVVSVPHSVADNWEDVKKDPLTGLYRTGVRVGIETIVGGVAGGALSTAGHTVINAREIVGRAAVKLAPQSGGSRLTLCWINDNHSRVVGPTGLARVATKMDQITASNEAPVHRFNLGDEASGNSQFAFGGNGRVENEVINQMDMTAATFGNHAVDLGGGNTSFEPICKVVFDQAKHDGPVIAETGLPRKTSVYTNSNVRTGKLVKSQEVAEGDKVFGTVKNAKGEERILVEDSKVVDQALADTDFAQYQQPFFSRTIKDSTTGRCVLADVEESIVKPYRMIEIPTADGKSMEKIACIGLTTTELEANGIVALDPILNAEETIIPTIAHARAQGAERIIINSHLGLEQDIVLAQKIKHVDAIIGGHSHDSLARPVWVKGSDGRDIPIQQAGTAGEFVGELKLVFKKGVGVDKFRTEGRLHPINESVPEKAELADYIKTTKTYKGVEELTARPVDPEIPCVLKEAQFEDGVRNGETGYGNLITDAQLAGINKRLAASGEQTADCMIKLSGDIRAGLPAGEELSALHTGDAFCNAHNAEELIVANMKGSHIAEALEFGVADLRDNPQPVGWLKRLKNCFSPEEQKVGDLSGNFNQVSGLRYKFDLTRPQYSRVSDIQMFDKTTGKWVSVDAGKSYKVATLAYPIGKWGKKGVFNKYHADSVQAIVKKYPFLKPEEAQAEATHELFGTTKVPVLSLADSSATVSSIQNNRNLIGLSQPEMLSDYISGRTAAVPHLVNPVRVVNGRPVVDDLAPLEGRIEDLTPRLRPPSWIAMLVSSNVAVIARPGRDREA